MPVTVIAVLREDRADVPVEIDFVGNRLRGRSTKCPDSRNRQNHQAACSHNDRHRKTCVVPLAACCQCSLWLLNYSTIYAETASVDPLYHQRGRLIHNSLHTIPFRQLVLLLHADEVIELLEGHQLLETALR